MLQTGPEPQQRHDVVRLSHQRVVVPSAPMFQGWVTPLMTLTPVVGGPEVTGGGVVTGGGGGVVVGVGVVVMVTMESQLVMKLVALTHSGDPTVMCSHPAMLRIGLMSRKS